MMMLFYISGIITGASVLGMLWYRYRFSTLKSEYDSILTINLSLLNQNVELSKFREEKNSRKRRARLTTEGWYRSSDKDNKNKNEWDVIFELREVAQAVDDEHKYKFEIVGVFSERESVNHDGVNEEEFYKKWFMSSTGGGWVDTKSTTRKFEWITIVSKSEAREDKLNDLGIQ
jgi:hypothetical protein